MQCYSLANNAFKPSCVSKASLFVHMKDLFTLTSLSTSPLYQLPIDSACKHGTKFDTPNFSQREDRTANSSVPKYSTICQNCMASMFTIIQMQAQQKEVEHESTWYSRYDSSLAAMLSSLHTRQLSYASFTQINYKRILASLYMKQEGTISTTHVKVLYRIRFTKMYLT